MEFSRPLLLLIIPALIAFIVFTSRRMLKLPVWRKRVVISLRVIVFCLIALCLAGFGIKKYTDSVTSIFLVDGSDSMSHLKANEENFIKSALKSKNPREKVGIIRFGENSGVEMAPNEKPSFSSLEASINGNFTNIEEGLKLASTLIPAGDRKRIILVSDGLENDGNALREAKLLKQQDITLDVFKMSSVPEEEVQLKELSIPENIRKDQSFEVSVRVDSTVKTSATLKLYAQRELVAQKNVEISKGQNNFVFSDAAKKGGVVTYTAVIEPLRDTIIKNNTRSAFSYVEDKPSLMVIQDSDEAASELVKILGKDAQVTVSSPLSLPKSIGELSKYDAFILSNVSAERLEDGFLKNLEVLVRQQGKGLLVTGGDNSFALGGYYKTDLEKVLPVNMDITPKEEQPNLALVLVIDKSGSMTDGQYGITKLELAKEAALRSSEVLKKQDSIGVIAFDDAVQWVAKTGKLDDLKAVQDKIGSIRPGGGTQILPPLEEAVNSLKNVDAKIKHIILLTDGQAERSGYEPIIDELSRNKITLSTVAVGTSADKRLLEALSMGGNGRFYVTDEFSDIPKIFTKETFLAGKTYLNNRTFMPSLKSYSDILKNIKAVPALDGYVGTTPKSTAKVIFASDKDDPVLATWQYGLGRTAAWTSDVKGMWTGKWLSWGETSTFWKNLVSWVVQKRQDQEFSIKGGMKGGGGTIELSIPPGDGAKNDSVEASVISPSGKEQTVVLSPVSPEEFKGDFKADETGVYLTNVNVKSGNEVVKAVQSAISIPYSPEYDLPDKDAGDFLRRLAAEGGGRVIKGSDEVFSGKVAPSVGVTDMTPYLLLVLVILFFMDIAVRRVNVSGKWIKGALEKVEGAAGVVFGPVSWVAGKLAGFKRVKIEKEVHEVKKEERKVEKKEEKVDSSHLSVLLEKKRMRK